MSAVHARGEPFTPTLSDADLRRIGEGKELGLYEKLGAQLREVEGVQGTAFAVWAPNAKRVSVVGDFNDWDGRRNEMRCLGDSGVWEAFVPGVGQGTLYKFQLLNALGQEVEKTDPMGRFFEKLPKNAAIVWDTTTFQWSDHAWLEQRAVSNALESPISIYEVHLGSWRKHSDAESYSYLELADELVGYIQEMGFTHVEFMPVAEHAYYPSWGYQVTGFYAPTSRYGTPHEFAALIDALHVAGIGVILDWVPAHFPKDDFALAQFDGTTLYEHPDPRRGEHPDWGTNIFDYGRSEVRNFLIANALYWCDCFHIDGLRVDAVASMLYLDYSRKKGEWLPNKDGGREHFEAITFLQHVNSHVLARHPGVVTIAEESTQWPKVSGASDDGGLGFSFKWNMGWMHDNLGFLRERPENRKRHFDNVLFAMLYHYNENFVLPLSHDEVVHLKRSLIGKMPGNEQQRAANLRLLLGYQWTFPGKQLLFMGGELGQADEWSEDRQLDWPPPASPGHCMQLWVRDLNRLYRAESALWEADYDVAGFQWVNCDPQAPSVLSFLRRNKSGAGTLLVVVNFGPVTQSSYRIGVPLSGSWEERLNSDATLYGGANIGNNGCCHTQGQAADGFDQSLLIALPPLALVVFRLGNLTSQ